MTSTRRINDGIGELALKFAGRSVVDSHNDHSYSSEASAESDSSSEPDAQDDRSTRLLVAQESGIVKWYDPHRGYGFLVRPDGSELFVHRQRVVMAAGEAPLLRARAQLSFDVWRSPHGRLEAQNVRTTWGRPISNRVSGKRYSLIRREFHESRDLAGHGQMTPRGGAQIRRPESDHPQIGHCPLRQAAVRSRYSSRKIKEPRKHCVDRKS
ncbi:hypothetical protein BIW11_07733 [Tropilaelaps mercedesae]|uniref:CSD domain-containing protein n=1 Tax=Tropilaelaps mercedesae TaxID=418985 RepID=A0A1V9XSN8_9ACAR|nr:hypothetical protein BIW11_07733 [Tropilaelaps mercedesae]